MADRTPPPVAHEASIIWFGVEIVLELSSASACGGSPVSGGGEVGGGALIVTGARTECAWAGARLSVSAAARHASGGTIEAFLDTLAGAMNVNEATGGACDVECAAAVAGSTALNGAGTPAARGAAIAVSSTGPSAGRGSLSSGSPGDATPAAGHSTSSRSPCHSSRRSSAAPPPHRFSSQCESLGDSEDTSASSECEDDNDFAGWLRDRPPLWRFEHASQGLAWDYPPTKAEKHELLLLQLFAEERERQARRDAIQDSCASPDESTGARRRCSSTH